MHNNSQNNSHNHTYNHHQRPVQQNFMSGNALGSHNPHDHSMAWRQNNGAHNHGYGLNACNPQPQLTEEEIKFNIDMEKQSEAITVRAINDIRATLCAHAARRVDIHPQAICDDLMAVFDRLKTAELDLFSKHLKRPPEQVD